MGDGSLFTKIDQNHGTRIPRRRRCVGLSFGGRRTSGERFQFSLGTFARVSESGAPQGLLRCERERDWSPGGKSDNKQKSPHYNALENSANDQDIDMRPCTDRRSNEGPICRVADGSTSGRDGMSGTPKPPTAVIYLRVRDDGWDGRLTVK